MNVIPKPSLPQRNGKVERSHRSDDQAFYQILSYTGDVDLNAKLAEWEMFDNLAIHGAQNGKTAYEALRETLESRSNVSRPVVILHYGDRS